MLRDPDYKPTIKRRHWFVLAALLALPVLWILAVLTGLLPIAG